MKFDFDSMTPGTMILPSGSLTCSNRVYSCAWRGFAASNEIVAGRAVNAISMISASGTSQWCGPS
jgi:hypothetical protein